MDFDKITIDAVSYNVKDSTARKQISDETTELNSRISTIIADGQQTEGNTELIDIRTGADGKVYPTAGDAVRGQIGKLKEDYSALSGKVGENTSGISQLKKDLDDVKEVSSAYKLLSSDDYTYVEGKNTGFDVAKKVLTHNVDNYSAYSQIDVTSGEKYIIYCGGKKSTSTTYPVVMLAFSKDGTSYLPPENYNYDPFAGVSENTNTKVNEYSVTVPKDAKYMFVSTSAKGNMPIIIYKHIEVDSAKYNGLLGKIEKDKNGLYGLDDLNFVLKTAQRHFLIQIKCVMKSSQMKKCLGQIQIFIPKPI